jgi:hypothetical protein
MRAVLAGLLLLAACAAHERAQAPSPVVSEQANQATEADTCGAVRFIHLIGTPADQIDRSTLPPRTRILTPDMMVTADFSAERLNIMIGTDGKVGSFRCF